MQPNIVLNKLIAPLKNVPIEIQVEILRPVISLVGGKSSAHDDETELNLKEDVTPVTSVTDVIETIIHEATDTQINVNSGQSKEVGFLKR